MPGPIHGRDRRLIMKMTHVDKKGKASMVDITAKKSTHRLARAVGYIKTNAQVVSLISKNLMAKGDVFSVAQIAGILGAKQTPNLIPLCHPLLITNAKININIAGKTGTAQNPHGKDHSVFICFAPRDNPKIAIVAYIENAGFGATWAAPIASLLTEMYLTRKIERKDMEAFILQGDLIGNTTVR